MICLLLVMAQSKAQPKAKGLPEAVDSHSPWLADLGNGQYQNPIIYADYSDPDICRVGNDFYMTSSSFNAVPALPILHSTDLVNWRIINHAVTRFPGTHYQTVQHGNGVWAPSLRHHRGWFYIYWGDPDQGIFMVKTQDPAGEWSAPVLVKKAYGNIDPCPLWDDDGKVYMVHAFANSRAGLSDVLQVQELTADGAQVTRNRKIVFNGYPENFTLEGPKFYKRNGFYYIFAPAGGVATGWQLVLRSKSPFGPYEAKKVLAQGRTAINGPHQGGYVELDNGEGWFVHFQEKQPYGRIVHMQPVHWESNWPVMGQDDDGDGIGEPVLTHKKPTIKSEATAIGPQTSDDFSTGRLGMQWQWQANPEAAWYSLSDTTGQLRLHAWPLPENATNLWNAPNLLLQKFPAPAFTATTRIDAAQLEPDEKSGIVVFGLDYATLSLLPTDNGTTLEYTVAEEAHEGMPEQIKETIALNTRQVLLLVVVEEGGMCRFSFSTDGNTYTTIGSPFQAVEGRWVGAKLGLFAIKTSATGERGHALFDWFRIQ
jgi:beta-xylosidase